MATPLKPSTPLPPGVVPSESRDDFEALLDREEKSDDKDPRNLVKEVTNVLTSKLKFAWLLYVHFLQQILNLPSHQQGELSRRPEEEVAFTENSGVAETPILNGTPSHAWISPEKRAQKFQIDLSE